ncbi:MAG: AMP-binding protein [Prolixibacteraceae bacterium]|jgi:O-succinylbenzoic acid--CoA ligase|nr:AMP-binding protein [Prolixibacteraceae bacterium]
MNTVKIQINNIFLDLKDIQEKLNDSNLHDWEKNIYKFILNWLDDSDFILQQTSGSTGIPKKIRLKKSAMIASSLKTIHSFNLKAYDTAWLCLPIEYIAGKMMAVRAIVGNLNLILSEPTGTPTPPINTIDFTAMVPLQVQQLVKDETNFKSIRKLIIGGASINSQITQSVQKIPTQVFATYGMTETASHIALQRLNGPNPDEHYHLLPGISISVNKNNCLQINAPELSAKVLETSDIVELISSNEFKLLGRIDNIINSGGIKISPEELEKQITTIIKKECLIVPAKDEILGQKLVLLLEGKEDKVVTEKYLLQIKNELGKLRTPKAVYYISEFPKNSSMKIDRKKLKKLIINL